jgi:predicted DCC family thiol-disulfide oxidoreductase YuxK
MPEPSSSSVASPQFFDSQKQRGELRTSPPGKYIVLYDGRCPFCTRQSQRLVRFARQGLVETVDFHEPGVLKRFPGLTYECCMKAIHLVTPDGRVFRGPEAIVRALATRPIFAWIAPVYYLPGLRQLVNAVYAFVARNRYRFWGKTLGPGECPGGTCEIHGT